MANLLGEITGRPKEHDDAILKEASLKFAEELWRWCKSHGDKAPIEEYEETAFEVIQNCFGNYDGYHIANVLEDHHHYSADESLVGICSGVWVHVENAYSKALSLWIKDNNVVCPFNIGDKVAYYRNVSGNRIGLIKEIYKDIAICTVFNADYGHGVVNGGCTQLGDCVNFEDITLVEDKK